MEPGNVYSIWVQFLEDRGGRALVRLPNGSKTSLPYESLELVALAEDLVAPIARDHLVKQVLPSGRNDV